jgi:site-specific recombinase XerC
MSPAELSECELLVRSWLRSLRARNLSARTVQSYAESAGQLLGHSGAARAEHLTRAVVEEFLADLGGRYKPTTVSVRYRALQQFFRWLVDEDELARNPMAKMRPPVVPETPSIANTSAADRRNRFSVYFPGCHTGGLPEVSGRSLRRRRGPRDHGQPLAAGARRGRPG